MGRSGILPRGAYGENSLEGGSGEYFYPME